MKSRPYVFIYLKYRPAGEPVRRYWTNKPLKNIDEAWALKRCQQDRHFEKELRKRLHALTFPYRFWRGDFNKEEP